MKNRFTQAEVEELVDSVRKNPENLNRVFRELSVKWGTHSVDSIKFYYYTKVKNSNELFLTLGEKKAFLNRKVVKEGDRTIPIRVRKTIWVRIKNLLKLK